MPKKTSDEDALALLEAYYQARLDIDGHDHELQNHPGFGLDEEDEDWEMDQLVKTVKRDRSAAVKVLAKIEKKILSLLLENVRGGE